MLYNLFIGSNNSTHKVELAKIKKATGRMFEGFTIIPATGYWQGKPEKSVIVQIEAMDRDQVVQLAELLKIELKQDAIAMQELPQLSFI